MKRKIACMAILISLFAANTSLAFAAGTNTYRIDELDMSVDLPSEYVVFTREIEVSALIFA